MGNRMCWKLGMSTLNLHKSGMERYLLGAQCMSLQSLFEKFERKVYIRLSNDETAFVCTLEGMLGCRTETFPVKEACRSERFASDGDTDSNRQ